MPDVYYRVRRASTFNTRKWERETHVSIVDVPKLNYYYDSESQKDDKTERYFASLDEAKKYAKEILGNEYPKRCNINIHKESG